MTDPIDVTMEPAVVSELAVDRATVLVGEAHEPWDFPVEMLPEQVEAGSFLLVEMHDGRPASVTINHEHEAMSRKGLDHRLARLARYERLTGHQVRVD